MLEIFVVLAFLIMFILAMYIVRLEFKLNEINPGLIGPPGAPGAQGPMGATGIQGKDGNHA